MKSSVSSLSLIILIITVLHLFLHFSPHLCLHDRLKTCYWVIEPYRELQCNSLQTGILLTLQNAQTVRKSLFDRICRKKQHFSTITGTHTSIKVIFFILASVQSKEKDFLLQCLLFCKYAILF